jgi:hypothetical protein
MPVVDKDHGWSELAKRLDALTGDEHVLVGVLGQQASAAHPGSPGVTNLDIRATLDIYEAKLLQMSAKLGKGVVAGAFTAGQALELLGEHVVGLMKERINARIPPPNKPSTIKRKGSDVPLIGHTGQLKNSLSYKLGGVA